MGGEECVGAVDQHVPKLEGLSGKTEHSVAALNHLRPHVVERIRQERQGTHVLSRVLGRPSGDDVHEPLGLEPCREQFGRPAHDLVQLRLAQRRHFDQAMNGIKRLVLLQVAEKVRPHAHHCTQARVAEATRDNLRETETLTLLGANVKLLSLSM